MNLINSLRQNGYFLFELFIVVRMTAQFMPQIVKNMLVQDKVCLYTLKLNATFCQDLHGDFNTTAEKDAKNAVLAESAIFGNYV